MTKLLILVTPHPFEAHLVTHEQADAALAWLKDRLGNGTFLAAAAFPATGGYVMADVPDGDPAEQARALFRGYPLEKTIDLDARVLISLTSGFHVLHAAIDLREEVTS